MPTGDGPTNPAGYLCRHLAPARRDLQTGSGGGASGSPDDRHPGPCFAHHRLGERSSGIPGRLALSLPPLKWFERVLDLGVDLASLTPAILIASSTLPGPPLRDPADRIIATTARDGGYRLMTRDQPLLDFAADGQVAAIAC